MDCTFQRQSLLVTFDGEDFRCSAVFRIEGFCRGASGGARSVPVELTNQVWKPGGSAGLAPAATSLRDSASSYAPSARTSPPSLAGISGDVNESIFLERSV